METAMAEAFGYSLPPDWGQIWVRPYGYLKTKATEGTRPGARKRGKMLRKDSNLW